jgi:hypothetical protein
MNGMRALDFVFRPEFMWRFRESSHDFSHAHREPEPGRPVWCPGFSVFGHPDILKGGHQTRWFMERLLCIGLDLNFCLALKAQPANLALFPRRQPWPIRLSPELDRIRRTIGGFITQQSI